MENKKLPRGIRNCNPLNIRIGNNWRGEAPINNDGVFEQFVSMKWGIRAAVRLLRRYQLKYKRYTITEIISAWAPANENNTRAYIASVSNYMKIDKDTYINLKDNKILCLLIYAMIEVETGTKIGQYVTEDDVSQGIELANMEVERY